MGEIKTEVCESEYGTCNYLRKSSLNGGKQIWAIMYPAKMLNEDYFNTQMMYIILNSVNRNNYSIPGLVSFQESLLKVQ